MTEEVKPEALQVEDQEEGEILEDGEIADDEDDIVALGQNGDPAPGPNNEKENKEISNQTPFAGTFSSYYVDRYILTDCSVHRLPMETQNCNAHLLFHREDTNFKPNKRKRKNNTKKRKRSNSTEVKRKLGDQNAVDISDCLHDNTFDSVELNDEEDYSFDMLDFDVIMEILGCTASKDLIDVIPPTDKSVMMLRIVKIMKQLHGNGSNSVQTLFNWTRIMNFSFI